MYTALPTPRHADFVNYSNADIHFFSDILYLFLLIVIYMLQSLNFSQINDFSTIRIVLCKKDPFVAIIWYFFTKEGSFTDRYLKSAIITILKND